MDAGRAWTCPVTGITIPMEYGFEMEGGMYLTDKATIQLLTKLNEGGNSKTVQWMVETGIGAGRILPLKLYPMENGENDEA